MISLDEASIILARDCKVNLYTPPEDDTMLLYIFWEHGGADYSYPWHITEDRCRPMLVDYYGITTEQHRDSWVAHQSGYAVECLTNKISRSPTSRGAQIICLRVLAEIIKLKKEVGSAGGQ